MTRPSDDELEAMALKMMSQVGDDVHQVYDHEALFKQAAALRDMEGGK